MFYGILGFHISNIWKCKLMLSIIVIFAAQRRHTMNEELKRLIAWFEAYQVTFNELTLSEYEHIFDLRTYIEVYVNSVKRNYDNPTFSSDIDKLKRLKKVLEERDNLIKI